jgi:hypothetical protein
VRTALPVNVIVIYNKILYPLLKSVDIDKGGHEDAR